MKKSAITVLKNIIREEISKLISEDNGPCVTDEGCPKGYEHVFLSGEDEPYNLCRFPEGKRCINSDTQVVYTANKTWYRPRVGYTWRDEGGNEPRLKPGGGAESAAETKEDLQIPLIPLKNPIRVSRGSKSRSRGNYRYLSGGRVSADFGSRMKTWMHKRYGFSNAAGFIKFYKELEARAVIKKTRGKRSKFLIGPKKGKRFIKDKIFGPDHGAAVVALLKLSKGKGNKEESQYIGVHYKGCESPRGNFQRMVCGMPPGKDSVHHGLVIELPYSRSGGRLIWVPTDEKLARKIQKAQHRRFGGSWIDVNLVRCLQKTQTESGCRPEIKASLKKYWKKRAKEEPLVVKGKKTGDSSRYDPDAPADSSKSVAKDPKSKSSRKYRQSAAEISGTFSMYTDLRNKAYWDKKGGMKVSAALKALATQGHPFAKKLKSWVEKGAKGDPPKQTKKDKKSK